MYTPWRAEGRHGTPSTAHTGAAPATARHGTARCAARHATARHTTPVTARHIVFWYFHVAIGTVPYSIRVWTTFAVARMYSSQADEKRNPETCRRRATSKTFLSQFPNQLSNAYKLGLDHLHECECKQSGSSSEDKTAESCVATVNNCSGCHDQETLLSDV